MGDHGMADLEKLLEAMQEALLQGPRLERGPL